MICNKCNHRLPDDSEFCQYCGTPIISCNNISNMEKDKDVSGVANPAEPTPIVETSNIAFEKVPQITQTFPVEATPPVQQPQIVNVIEQTNINGKKARNKKVRYCSRCGSLIDNETKQCTGCGKKYFRGIRFNKTSSTVFSLSLALLVAIAFIVYQHINIKILKEESLSLHDDIDILKSQLSTLNTQQIDDSVDLRWEYIVELKFFRDYAEIVPDDNSKTYHKYGCPKIENADHFWIFNTDGAISEGYKECIICH